MSTEKTSIGERLKKIRTDEKLTLEAVRETSSCHESTISKIENGIKKKPYFETVEKIVEGEGYEIKFVKREKKE
jgi:transcriptional regulator with XRE-family HTH domain